MQRGLAEGLCGFGGQVEPSPEFLRQAAERAASQHDERLARRIERFAAVPDGALVWTRDEAAFLWLGRISGPWRYDDRPGALAADLVHVRPCAWREVPVPHHLAPSAVLATFERGGRNWQQIHDPLVSEQSLRLWEPTGDAAARTPSAIPEFPLG